MEVDYGGFSIREYMRHIRTVQVRKCWPFPGEITGDFIQSLLPPITVAKFRWWSHELASLLTKSPVPVDDSDPSFQRKAKAKSSPCKKRSIVNICAPPPEIQLPRRMEDRKYDSDVLIGPKRKRTKDHVVQTRTESKKFKHSGDQKFANKVNKCKEEARDIVTGEKCSLGIEESSGFISLSNKMAGSVSKDHDSEFQIPAIFKAKRKVCFVRSPDNSKTNAPQCERHHVRFSHQGGNLSQLKTTTASSEFCCLEMNRLSLTSSEAHSPVNDNQVKLMSDDQTSVVMHLQSRQQDKFQPAVSERIFSHAQAKPDLSCFHGPHHSSQERVKDALDLERKEHDVAQHASADMHSGTLLYQTPFDPLLMELMHKSVLYTQRHVGETILGFPLNLQGDLVDADGDGCGSFDRSGLCSGSSKSAFTENDLSLGNLVDFSSEKKHSTEPALAKDSASRFPAHNEERHIYFPARLGLDETFTEKAYFTNNSDGECAHTVHSPVSEVNPRSHTINMSKQNGPNQNLNNGNMILKLDDLCLQNTQAATMRLMGKDVSVGTSYSGMVRTGERIIAPDASVNYSSLGSHTNQSLLWRRTTFEVSENHSTTTLDKNWNKAFLHDTSKDHFPLFCEPHVSLASQRRRNVIPESEYPPTILNPCCSLASCPLSDKDLNFQRSGLGVPNSFTFSQQQPPLPPYYNNVDIGLLPDARKPYFGLPFSCADSTRRSPWPQSSFESSCSGMSFMNPAEQTVCIYGPKSSSYINIGTTNKQVAFAEEYPMKNHEIPNLPMQGGAKEFLAGQQIRK